MQLALGIDGENEAMPGMSQVSACIEGQCGLFFTNEKKELVKKCALLTSC